jgi:hypothetical protein
MFRRYSRQPIDAMQHPQAKQALRMGILSVVPTGVLKSLFERCRTLQFAICNLQLS